MAQNKFCGVDCKCVGCRNLPTTSTNADDTQHSDTDNVFRELGEWIYNTRQSEIGEDPIAMCLEEGLSTGLSTDLVDLTSSLIDSERDLPEITEDDFNILGESIQDIMNEAPESTSENQDVVSEEFIRSIHRRTIFKIGDMSALNYTTETVREQSLPAEKMDTNTTRGKFTMRIVSSISGHGFSRYSPKCIKTPEGNTNNKTMSAVGDIPSTNHRTKRKLSWGNNTNTRRMLSPSCYTSYVRETSPPISPLAGIETLDELFV